MFVLIADNQPVFQKVLADILDEKQLPHQFCSTGDELLQAMDEQEVNLFVISMSIPDIDVASLCGEVRTKLQDDCIPIIILTSDDSDQRFSEIFEAGATDVFRRSSIDYFSDYIRRLSNSTRALEGRVMILEDSPSQRLILEEALVGWGLQVESFESTQPAYQAHLNNPFDIILTDIELKGLETGLDMVHDIRSQPFGIGDVPIIAITAYLSKSTRVNFLARGIDRCMLKPILLPELRSELRNRLESREICLTLERARQQEKNASKAQSNFVAKMSHELRTSLNAILGFSSLLITNKNVKKEVDEYAGKINDAGKRLLNIMSDVLNLSKIEAGTADINIEVVPLKRVLKHCVEQMGEIAKKQEINFKIEPLDTNINLRCDENRLLEVMLNLIANAIKFNRPGGHVIVSYVPIAADTIRINVVDNGLGIDHQDVDVIFEPFANVEREYCDEQGVGIGLPVSVRLMRLMGGDLGFSSKLAEGSDFWVDVPLAVESCLNANQGQPTDQLAPCRVIYVDDNPVNLLLVESWFKNKTQADITIAESADEGLALISKLKPDLVISDINMPGHNGYWLLNKIRNDQSIGATPVIALSAMEYNREHAGKNEDQFDGYITKPIDFQVLIKTINRLI